MTQPCYTVLSGGVGGAKLVEGLSNILPSDKLQVVANTADDFEHIGLPISPDIDTLLYTLAGLANPQTGWGLKNESWQFMDQLAKLGGPDWFRLGDKDLAMHIRRGELLASGNSLSDVTNELRMALGVQTPIWPMSDAAIRTIIHTADGDLPFQDYFVRLRAEPVATGFSYTGAATASASPQALAALSASSLGGIFLAPSNPWLSIEPILSLQAIKSTILTSNAPVIAVAPIIAGAAVKGPTAKLMHELGMEPGVAAIAWHYKDLLDGLIIDQKDAHHQQEIEKLGIRVGITQTLMQTLADKVSLANFVIKFAGQLQRERN